MFRAANVARTCQRSAISGRFFASKSGLGQGQWDSFSLDEEDHLEFLKKLGIKKKDLAKGNTTKKSNTYTNHAVKSKINMKHVQDERDFSRIKGFLEINHQLCSGCGTPFQSSFPSSPGYLTPDKLLEHRSRAEILRARQDAINILNMAGIELDSAKAEEILLAADVPEHVIDGVKLMAKSIHRHEVPTEKWVPPIESTTEEGSPSSVIPVTVAEEDPMTDLPVVPENHLSVCQRCFRLTQYNDIDEENLRPGWSNHELLTPQRFEKILTAIKATDAVVLCIIDIFDISGSTLKNLKQLAGNNPIVIAANKIDLLPIDASKHRLITWIHQEMKDQCELTSPKEADHHRQKYIQQEMQEKGWFQKVKPEEEEEGVLRRSNVHLVSVQKGIGIDALMQSVSSIAMSRGQKVYVMGAANVGKSSFINRLLESGLKLSNKKKDKSKRNAKSDTPRATVSHLPGTTLDFIKIKMVNGITMIDTPGLINSGQMTSRLTAKELRNILPSKSVGGLTIRVLEGKTVLMGGLARIALVEGNPFFFTFFVSDKVTLHPTDTEKADDILNKHIGTPMLSPPSSRERMDELGALQTRLFEINGDSWSEASVDIVIAGLGWVSITGPGKAVIRVTVPEGTHVSLRAPLLPFEAKSTTAKFTGGRFIKKSAKRGPDPNRQKRQMKYKKR